MPRDPIASLPRAPRPSAEGQADVAEKLADRVVEVTGVPSMGLVLGVDGDLILAVDSLK
jgi:hypothetical protein